MHEKDANLKAQIMQAATDHLHAKSALEALSHFTKDIVAVSNDKLFSSFEALAEDVTGFYEILKKVNLAEWHDIQIRIVSTTSATFTAKFRYSFTTIENEYIDLSGVWSVLFVLVESQWKIKLRHESFFEQKNLLQSPTY